MISVVSQVTNDQPQGVIVTYLGEVEVKVRPIGELDLTLDYYVIASNPNDGRAIIKPITALSPTDAKHLLGKVLPTSSIRTDGDDTFVIASVCVNYNAIGVKGLSQEFTYLSVTPDQVEIQTIPYQPSRVLVCFDGLAYFFKDLNQHFFGDKRKIFDFQSLLARILCLNPALIEPDAFTLAKALNLFNGNRAAYENTPPQLFRSLHQQFGAQSLQVRRPTLQTFSDKVSLFYLLLPASQAEVFQRLANAQFHCGGVVRCVDVVDVQHLWPDQPCTAWSDDPSESRWLTPLHDLADEETVSFGFSSIHSHRLDHYFLHAGVAPPQPVSGPSSSTEVVTTTAPSKWSILFSSKIYSFLCGTADLNDQVHSPVAPPKKEPRIKLVLNTNSYKHRKVCVPAKLISSFFPSEENPGEHYPIYMVGFDLFQRSKNGNAKISYGASNQTGFLGKRKVGKDTDWVDTAVRELSEGLFFEPDPDQFLPLRELKDRLKKVFLQQSSAATTEALQWLEQRGFRKITFRTSNSRHFAYSRGLLVLLHFDMKTFSAWLINQPGKLSGYAKALTQKEAFKPGRTYIPIKRLPKELQWMAVKHVDADKNYGHQFHTEGQFCPNARLLKHNGTDHLSVYQLFRFIKKHPKTWAEISLSIFDTIQVVTHCHSEKRVTRKVPPFEECNSALKLVDSWGMTRPWLEQTFPEAEIHLHPSNLSAIVQFTDPSSAYEALRRFLADPAHDEIYCRPSVPPPPSAILLVVGANQEDLPVDAIPLPDGQSWLLPFASQEGALAFYNLARNSNVSCEFVDESSYPSVELSVQLEEDVSSNALSPKDLQRYFPEAIDFKPDPQNERAVIVRFRDVSQAVAALLANSIDNERGVLDRITAPHFRPTTMLPSVGHIHSLSPQEV